MIKLERFCIKLLINALFLLTIFVNCDEFECPQDSEKKIFCYYKSPDVKISNDISLDHTLSSMFHHNKPPCTHLIYAFAGLDINGNIVVPEKSFNNILRLKEKDPCLKILISVGGWNEGSEKFSSLVETEKSIETFAEMTLKFLIFYGFDGIDIHWMYPTMRGGIKEDRQNFVKLIKSLKAKLSKRNKLVVAAIGSKSHHLTEAYSPMSELCDSLDYAILLTFDYFERAKTSIGAPLVNDDHHVYRETIAENVQKILNENCKPEKLIFGISTYGRIFKLKRSSKHNIGAELSDDEIDGESQFMEYYKICSAIKEKSPLIHTKGEKVVSWTTKLLTKSLSKYSFYDGNWISYDDFEAVELKTLYVLKKNLGGVMFYTLNGDHFNKECKLYFPLITRSAKLIKEYELKNCNDKNFENCVKEIQKEHKLNVHGVI